MMITSEFTEFLTEVDVYGVSVLVADEVSTVHYNKSKVKTTKDGEKPDTFSAATLRREFESTRQDIKELYVRIDCLILLLVLGRIDMNEYMTEKTKVIVGCDTEFLMPTAAESALEVQNCVNPIIAMINITKITGMRPRSIFSTYIDYDGSVLTVHEPVIEVNMKIKTGLKNIIRSMQQQQQQRGPQITQAMLAGLPQMPRRG